MKQYVFVVDPLPIFLVLRLDFGVLTRKMDDSLCISYPDYDFLRVRSNRCLKVTVGIVKLYMLYPVTP